MKKPLRDLPISANEPLSMREYCFIRSTKHMQKLDHYYRKTFNGYMCAYCAKIKK